MKVKKPNRREREWALKTCPRVHVSREAGVKGAINKELDPLRFDVNNEVAEGTGDQPRRRDLGLVQVVAVKHNLTVIQRDVHKVPLRGGNTEDGLHPGGRSARKEETEGQTLSWGEGGQDNPSCLQAGRAQKQRCDADQG